MANTATITTLDQTLDAFADAAAAGADSPISAAERAHYAADFAGLAVKFPALGTIMAGAHA